MKLHKRGCRDSFSHLLCMTTILVLKAIIPKIVCEGLPELDLDRASCMSSQLVRSEFRSRARFSSPLFPAPQLSHSDDLFNLFSNLRNASVHFGWSSPNLRHLQWRQLHLNLLFRPCVVMERTRHFCRTT